MQWFARLYNKRIINVNVNILLAGALAIGIMYSVMNFVHDWGVDMQIANRTKTDVKFVNMALSFFIDLVADLAVYYVLHWYANHVPKKYGGTLIHPEYTDLSFLQDATKVQIERMVLSPLLYVIALGGQYLLMQSGSRPPTAAAIGFATGVVVSRVLHTFWMLYDQRRMRKRMAELAKAGAAPAVPAKEERKAV